MKKKTVWFVVAIFIVAGIVWLSIRKTNPPPGSSETSPSPSPSATAKTIKKPSSPSSEAQTYTDVVNQYAGKTIQFDDTCHGQPGQMTVKKGTKVLLNNRSTIAKTLSLDGQVISLPAYNYKVVTITTNKSLPYNLGIDCKSQAGSVENTATVQIQAAILQLF